MSWKPLAEKWAAYWGSRYGVTVPADLVMAIISVESSGRPGASRQEPDGRISRGLMQVMPGTADQMGYRGNYARLFEPSYGVEVGTKYLAWQIRRYAGNLKHAIAAFNSGTAKFTKDGKYVNQGYVDKVFFRWKTSIPIPLMHKVVISAILALSIIRARFLR